MLSRALFLLLWLVSSNARAAENHVGVSVTVDGSTGLVTHIPRFGVHPGATWVLSGQNNGIQVDLALQQYTAYGLWERFPALSLSWSHAWGANDGLRPYHALGAGVALTGAMPTALAPALPMLRLEGGAEWNVERWWVRGGLASFAVVPGPILGAGPKLTVGAHF